jgi:UDPglucose 6-dehydrogenase
MKINLYGYGFVGKAHHSVLNKNYQLNVIDPKYPDLEQKDFEPDAAIICVSTPQSDDGACDMKNVYDVLETVSESVPVLIKSTISLEGWKTIKDQFPKHSINFSPEFLREAYFEDDFKNMQTMYLSEERATWWAKMFNPFWNNLQFVVGRTEELIMVKYFRNSYHAVKVSFFNQVHDLCEKTGLDFEEVRAGITQDSRIGPAHSFVTEERGFGGHCLPKDSAAIVKTAEEHDINLSILEEAINYNKKVRKEK